MSFNPGKFVGKRIYRKMNGFHNIHRIFIWNFATGKYGPPPKGNAYLAYRNVVQSNGKPERERRVFNDCHEAKKWQSVGAKIEDDAGGETFADAVAQWKAQTFQQLAHTTRLAYEKMLDLYFDDLMPMRMKRLDVKAVDRWISGLKDPNGRFMKSKRRIAFKHELSLLSGIVLYYREYIDASYQYPILERHRSDVHTGRTRKPLTKYLTVKEFFRFREELKKGTRGDLFAALATVQFFQALRISEAAGLCWEDVEFDEVSPRNSRLIVSRSIVWTKRKDDPSYLRDGYKNSASHGGSKAQPLFEESYIVLMGLRGESSTGLIFTIEGKHLDYRQAQYVYDEAFANAGLPHRGTHKMRHGGASFAYQSTHDLEVAKQLLGNSDLQTVLRYAKGEVEALDKFAAARWKSGNPLTTFDRKSP